MATPNVAIDWVNGEIMCPCTGSSGTAYVNLATGEVQCAIDCNDDIPPCQVAVSYQDGQLNPICNNS